MDWIVWVWVSCLAEDVVEDCDDDEDDDEEEWEV